MPTDFAGVKSRLSLNQMLDNGFARNSYVECVSNKLRVVTRTIKIVSNNRWQWGHPTNVPGPEPASRF